MKLLLHPLTLLGVILVLTLPSARVQSQLALQPLPTDPLAALQTLQKSNEDLLKRQDDTLKSLTDMTATANEVRIYSRRG